MKMKSCQMVNFIRSVSFFRVKDVVNKNPKFSEILRQVFAKFATVQRYKVQHTQSVIDKPQILNTV